MIVQEHITIVLNVIKSSVEGTRLATAVYVKLHNKFTSFDILLKIPINIRVRILPKLLTSMFT